MKIYIIGSSGSGKTTLAKKLSKKLKISYFDLDNIYWDKKYDTCNSKNRRLEKLDEILKNKDWIIEGVYTKWSKQAMDKSDLIIWININKYKIIFRIIKREIKNIFNKKYNSNIKQLVYLIKNAYNYDFKKKMSGYYEHKNCLDKVNKKYIVIKNKKDEIKLLKMTL
jgi:adenylate kinase family enzyme